MFGKHAFGCYLFLATVLGLEVALQVYGYFDQGRVIALRDVSRLDGRDDADAVKDTRQKLSPIYGYNLRPGWVAADGADLGQLGATGHDKIPDFWHWPANNYGFFSDVDYPYIGAPGTFYVAVLGGSVANGLALEGIALISEIVRRGVGERPVKIINLTGGGFKQPQQAIVLSYFHSIGQSIDLVINMDGLNEAYVGWDNAERFKAKPALPSMQFLYGLQNHFLSTNGGEASRAKIVREKIFELNRTAATTRSAIVHYVTQHRLGGLRRDAVKAESEIGAPVPGRTYPFMMQGRSFNNDDALSDYLADVWVRGSTATAAIAKAIGVPYIHAIQPNQYFGGRRFSSEESKLAFSEPPWHGSKIVPATYQKMLNRSGELARRGIVFLDLTPDFNPHSEQLYFDACCHFNKRGYEILLRGQLGEAIGNAVR